MNIAQLIAILLPLLAQVTPQLIKDVIDTIRGNPQNNGETDDEYIARINGIIDDNTARVIQQDEEIQNG